MKLTFARPDKFVDLAKLTDLMKAASAKVPTNAERTDLLELIDSSLAAARQLFFEFQAELLLCRASDSSKLHNVAAEAEYQMRIRLGVVYIASRVPRVRAGDYHSFNAVVTMAAADAEGYRAELYKSRLEHGDKT